MPSTKILVVDDEPGIRFLLEQWLEGAGHEVYTAANGWDALQVFCEQLPTLTVADLRMPGMDGFHLIQRIREISNAYVLALTSLSSEEHTIRGLDLGADEYLVKPVPKREFLARVSSLLRRATPPKEIPVRYSDDHLSMDFLTHQASIRGLPLNLRPTEFRLLSYLILNNDRVIDHQELLDRVWGDQAGSLDSLKWYISSLRTKIEDDSRTPRIIVTFPRVGYRHFPHASASVIDVKGRPAPKRDRRVKKAHPEDKIRSPAYEDGSGRLRRAG